MPVDRLLVNLLSTDLPGQKAFYTTLFEVEVAFDSDWFVQLRPAGLGFEIGLIAQNSEIVPAPARGVAQGFYLTLVVAAVDPLFETAREQGYTILQPPHDTFYGQRRLLLQDPCGVVVDISAPLAEVKL